MIPDPMNPDHKHVPASVADVTGINATEPEHLSTPYPANAADITPLEMIQGQVSRRSGDDR